MLIYRATAYIPNNKEPWKAYIFTTTEELTAIKEVVNRSDLQDTLHIFMQDANFRLSIGIDHKFCWNKNTIASETICLKEQVSHQYICDVQTCMTQLVIPFLVGASWTDNVMSFWLAGRIGLSDSACFLFMSLLNCLRSAQVRNFLTVTCSKSKHFSRYRRKSSSSERKSNDVRFWVLPGEIGENESVLGKPYLWTRPCTPPPWPWLVLRLLEQCPRAATL